MARVVIFGATSAIASEVALRLAKRGDRLFVVGRSEDKLASLVERLENAVVGSQVADLDEVEANADRVAEAAERLGGIDVAIAAHGLLGDQLATEREYAAAEQTIRTNFSSMVSLLVPIANLMESQGRGTIAVLTSVAGERGRPRNYTYGAAKGALTIYLQGLRSRLWPRVAVHNFKLGPVDTPMTVDHRKNALFASAPAVADRIVAGLDGRAGETYVPWFWAPIMAVVRRLPEPIFQRLGFLSGRG